MARRWNRNLSEHHSAPDLERHREYSMENQIALDPATGASLWQTKSAARHGSPVRLLATATADLLITPSGNAVTLGGKELVNSMFSLPFNAPVCSGTTIFACGIDDTKAQAWQVQLNEDGTATKKMLWETPIKKGRYFSSPVVIGDIVYAMRQSGQLTAIKFDTGAVLAEKAFDLGQSQFYPSLAVAGGKLYAFSDNGTTVVIEPGPELKELARNKLERIRSSPLFEGKRVYLRSWENAYCIEEVPQDR